MSDFPVDVVLTAPAPLALTLSDPLPVTLAVGIQGPAGPPGAALIGGYPVSMTSLASGDHLEFATETWVNVARTTITDGGNF